MGETQNQSEKPDPSAGLVFPFDDPYEPYNGVIEIYDIRAFELEGIFIAEMDAIVADTFATYGLDNHPNFIFELFEDLAVDYSLSNAAVSVDLERSVQHGGYAEGDVPSPRIPC